MNKGAYFAEDKKNPPLFDIQLGDITMLHVDAIVNAANKSLLGCGGVDGAIHRAAGIGLLEECQQLGGCETGEVKMTKGYNLRAKYVIHTVGPVYTGRDEDKTLLASCYINALECAKAHDIHSIAFPSISTGVYGYPVQEAAPLVLLTVETWLEKNPDYDIDIIFCCYDQKTYNAYKQFYAFVQTY